MFCLIFDVHLVEWLLKALRLPPPYLLSHWWKSILWKSFFFSLLVWFFFLCHFFSFTPEFLKGIFSRLFHSACVNGIEEESYQMVKTERIRWVLTSFFRSDFKALSYSYDEEILPLSHNSYYICTYTSYTKCNHYYWTDSKIKNKLSVRSELILFTLIVWCSIRNNKKILVKNSLDER